MPRINTEIPHALGRDQAVERLKGFLETLREQYKGCVRNLEESWTEDGTLTFAFKALGVKVGGRLDVGEHTVRFSGQMPNNVPRMFKANIQQKLGSQLARLLAQEKHVPVEGPVRTTLS